MTKETPGTQKRREISVRPSIRRSFKLNNLEYQVLREREVGWVVACAVKDLTAINSFVRLFWWGEEFGV